MSWMEIEGWTCKELLRWYDQVAVVVAHDALVVEVGVAYGRSLAYLTERMRDLGRGARIVGVDIWEGFQGDGQVSPEFWARVTSAPNPMVACVRELDRCLFDWQARTTLIRSSGVAAADGFGDGSVDVLFLDEHHTYESVGGAIRAWLPRVMSGGYLSGHDCNDHYPGVLQAVNELLPGAEVRPPHPDDNGWGGVWIWRKP